MTAGTTDTRERILDAGEVLFAEHGFAGASVRAITAAAGTNLNAINYHFGSKEGLFRAVVRRIMGPVSGEQLRRLDDLEAGRGEAPPVEDLVDAYVSPLTDLLERDRERGRAISRLVARVLADDGAPFLRAALDEAEEADDRYLRAFGRALPHLSTRELWWRFQNTAVVITFHRAAAFAGGQPPETEEDARAWVVAYVAAAMRAPAASASPPV